MRSFFAQWLQMNRVEEVGKDKEIFPDFTPELVTDLRSSLNQFLDEVMWSERSDYRELLQADYIYANDRIANFYGLKRDSTNEFSKVVCDPKMRSGVLTHPYLLAAFSYPKFTSPIHRGVFLTRKIVGRSLRPPPNAVVFKDADFSPQLTMREKVTELTKTQSCQSCHSVINPVGFALEHFDAVGRWRTEEKGKSINTESDYVTDDGEKVHLSGARDVADFASQSEHSQNAFIEQLFHVLIKQPILAYGPDTLEKLREGFVKSDFNMRKLVAEIALLAASHEMINGNS
jgi:hypothetical protein